MIRFVLRPLCVSSCALACPAPALAQTVTDDPGGSFVNGSIDLGANPFAGPIVYGSSTGVSSGAGLNNYFATRTPPAGTQIDTFRVASNLFITSLPQGANFAIQSGAFRFTANNNSTQYTITGSAGFQISGILFSGISINVSLIEVVSGNVLAQWSSGAAGFNFTGVLFDTVNPAQVGSWTGTLSAGILYEFAWSYQMNTQVGNQFDSLLSITPVAGSTENFLQIQFVPAPSAALAIALPGLFALRRRRSLDA